MIKKFLSLLMIGSLVLIYSCSKDEEKEPLSKEEGVEVLNSVGDEFTTSFDAMSESEGMVAMESLMILMQMDDPFGMFGAELKSSSRSSLEEKITDFITLRDMKSVVMVLEEPGFSDMTGTYTWNPDIQRWSVDATSPTDAIVIIFPTEEETPREATLTISDFEEVLIVDGTDQWYQPTKVKISMTLEGTEVASVDFSASFDAEGEPTSLDVSLAITPMEMSLNFNDNGSQIKLSTSLKMQDETIMSADVTVDYILQQEDGYEEMMPTKFDGFVHYGPIKLQGDVNIQKITEAMQVAQTEDDMVSAINNNANLAFYQYEGGKIADLQFVLPTSTTEEPELYDYVQLVFNDGSVEPIEPFLTKIITKIEQSLQELGLDLEELDVGGM